MDYPYANFGDFIFMRFGLSCGQADRQTDRQTDNTDIESQNHRRR